MKDQEPDNEGHAVGRQVQRLREDHLLRSVQLQGACLMTAQLARAGQHDADADRDADERQRLLKHVRPALALPRPPADQVADQSPGEPAGRPGLAGRDVQQLADEVGELGSGQRQDRGRGKADQPPASLAGQQPAQRPGNQMPYGTGDGAKAPGRRGVWHARPQVLVFGSSVRHGIQYGNVRQPGNQRFPDRSAAGPQLPGIILRCRARPAACAGVRRANPGSHARNLIAHSLVSIWKKTVTDKAVTKKAGARS